MPKKGEHGGGLLTTGDIARRIGIRYQTVHYWAKQGWLRNVAAGEPGEKAWMLFREDEVMEFLRERGYVVG